jgi:glycerol kinase
VTQPFILSLDQGTTSSRAIVFDSQGHVVAISQKEFPQYYPQPGWVEHNPEEIASSQLEVAREVLKKAKAHPSSIAGIGITNQRETTVVWNRKTGSPVYNALVWQDKRTAPFIDQLKKQGVEQGVKEKTGLVLDTYFSASKIRWILDHVDGARKLVQQGDLLFGTIDTWLLWKLSGGKLHITDYSNASRTLLFNINTLQWDPYLLDLFNIPWSMMPEVRNSSEVYGSTLPGLLGEGTLPVSGIAGDQQAALFGQGCFEEGQAKNTYGTGCFMLMNTGSKRISSGSGLLTTIAWKTLEGLTYALEGSVFIAGAAVQWLRDGLKLIKNSDESETLASSVTDTGGVYLVPAFAGLGAPYWDMHARGVISGLTQGTTYRHLVRAALESIAYQSRDVIEAMEKDAGIPLTILNVDGGASRNNFLMQFQSDILGIPVTRPVQTESTAFGVACLAGLAAGIWDMKRLHDLRTTDRVFIPVMAAAKRQELYEGWSRAVSMITQKNRHDHNEAE